MPENSHNNIHILSLAWYKIFPAQMGGQKGIAHFYTALAEAVRLTVLCAHTNEPPENLPYTVRPELPASKSQFFNPRVWRKIERAIRQIKPSHLLIEHPYYGLAALHLGRKYNLPVMVHAHNLEWQRFKTLHRFGWRLLKAYEGRVLRKAATVFFKTETDRQTAMAEHRVQAEKTMILPYGIWQTEPPSTAENERCRKLLHERYAIPAQQAILYFNGTLGYAPNREALENLRQHILPALDAKGFRYTLFITGAGSPGIAMGEKVIFAGLVNEVETFYKGATVFLNPVLSGGGIKTKLVEAIGFNLNAVSTPQGAAGLDNGICGSKLTIATGPAAFAEAIIAAAENRQTTPPAFYTQFYWPRIAAVAAAKIRGLVGK